MDSRKTVVDARHLVGEVAEGSRSRTYRETVDVPHRV
jgi:hypothetical protein